MFPTQSVQQRNSFSGSFWHCWAGGIRIFLLGCLLGAEVRCVQGRFPQFVGLDLGKDGSDCTASETMYLSKLPLLLFLEAADCSVTSSVTLSSSSAVQRGLRHSMLKWLCCSWTTFAGINHLFETVFLFPSSCFVLPSVSLSSISSVLFFCFFFFFLCLLPLHFPKKLSWHVLLLLSKANFTRF